MQVTSLAIPDVKLIKPKCFSDARGYFFESFKEKWFKENVFDAAFIQDNQVLSISRGTLRGLHYQKAPCAQGKLIRVLRGEIFDVAVDARPNSPNFGKWVSAILTATGQEQLWIPEGFLHGYCTLTDDCEVFYKVTAPYSPEHDAGIAFNDADIGIEWPIDISQAILSPKDLVQPKFREVTF